jgi:hypothetical protein
LTKEVSKSKDFNLISPQEQLRLNFFKLDESNENKSDLR